MGRLETDRPGNAWVIGVTGGVGAGKSTVLSYLEERWHAKLILADQVGHEVMEPGKEAYRQILLRFGTDVQSESGQIDRKILGNIVFADEEKRKKLNAIMAANTGKPIEIIEQDTERDHYMSAEEAKEYGLIDHVISAHE